jgi:hypothetical protein
LAIWPLKTAQQAPRALAPWVATTIARHSSSDPAFHTLLKNAQSTRGGSNITISVIEIRIRKLRATPLNRCLRSQGIGPVSDVGGFDGRIVRAAT